MRFTLYPIYWVADPHLDPEPFDHGILPFDITEGVRIKAVRDRFRPGTFALGADRHGTEIREQLEAVRYAIVHPTVPSLSLGMGTTSAKLSSTSVRRSWCGK